MSFISRMMKVKDILNYDTKNQAISALIPMLFKLTAMFPEQAAKSMKV